MINLPCSTRPAAQLAARFSQNPSHWVLSNPTAAFSFVLQPLILAGGGIILRLVISHQFLVIVSKDHELFWHWMGIITLSWFQKMAYKTSTAASPS